MACETENRANDFAAAKLGSRCLLAHLFYKLRAAVMDMQDSPVLLPNEPYLSQIDDQQANTNVRCAKRVAKSCWPLVDRQQLCCASFVLPERAAKAASWFTRYLPLMNDRFGDICRNKEMNVPRLRTIAASAKRRDFRSALFAERSFRWARPLATAAKVGFEPTSTDAAGEMNVCIRNFS